MQRCDSLGCGFVVRINGVRVDVERCFHNGMTRSVLNRLDVALAAYEERRLCVPKFMKA